MKPLKGSQRRHLRGLAHSLDPVVIVGKSGLSESLMRSVEQALDDHELIKIRFGEFKDQRKELAAEIAQQTKAALIGTIGHLAILYRAQKDEKRRRIRLPGS